MVIIRRPRSDSEESLAIQCIAEEFRRSYGTYPKERPNQLLAAFNEEMDVVGTISLQTGNLEEKFEVEHFFSFDIAKFFQGDRSKIMNVGRLTSRLCGLAPYLFCASIRYAQSLGIEFHLSFAQERVARAIIDPSGIYKMPATIHTDIPLRLKNIPKEYYPYFFNLKEKLCVSMWYTKDWIGRVDELMHEARGAIDIVLTNGHSVL